MQGHGMWNAGPSLGWQGTGGLHGGSDTVGHPAFSESRVSFGRLRATDRLAAARAALSLRGHSGWQVWLSTIVTGGPTYLSLNLSKAVVFSVKQKDNRGPCEDWMNISVKS